MTQLLADENLIFPVVDLLRRYDYDIVTLSDMNLAGQAIPDDEVLVLATSLKRCVITLNRKDFIKLHNQQPDHAGILVCTVDPNFLTLADRIHICLSQAGLSTTGQLLRVQRPAL